MGCVDDISSNVLASGYDKQEVDAFRRAVRDTFLRVKQPPVRSADVRPGEWFSTHLRGYHKAQVDAFLEVASVRKVAQAISDGVREAYPDAHVERVAVGKASAELIWFIDLQIVGGPTHRRRMTTDSGRKRHISREKKAGLGSAA